MSEPNAFDRSICRLCKRARDLQQSHITPKFAIKWMKQTGTGYFRRVANPNVRLQDSAKLQLLCRECEQRFAVSESYFASTIFRPFLGSARSVTYDKNLCYFAVSLLWRAMQRDRNQALSSTFSHNFQFAEAEEEWRKYLLGEDVLSRHNHLHLFISDLALENPPGVPRFNLYCTRAFDATFFESSGRCFIISKFSRFFFIGIISDYNVRDWIKTRISITGGQLTIPQEIRDPIFGGWLVARAKFAFDSLESKLSINQRKIINNHFDNNIEDLRAKDLFRADQADRMDHKRVISTSRGIGRNDLCPCNSGQKFKRCHGKLL